MNFLGHIYFSDNNPELMYANLFGDFIKGSDLSSYSPIIQAGIQLHRSIDTYIDHHPKVLKLMHVLYPELPKVTGIAIDLYFDYCLAKNWPFYHPTPLNEFLDTFYSYEPIHWEEYSEEFKEIIHLMKTKKWLSYYHTFEGLEKASLGVSKRISFKNTLQNAPEVYLRHEEKISLCFEEYMKDAIPYFGEKITSLEY